MLKKIQTHHELGNQMYRDYIQPANQDVFEIINDRLKHIDPNWHKKEILDFGCNVGHLLTTSNGAINPVKYTGVDVNKKSLDIAKDLHPDAAWIHYNGYNSTFNPTGKIDEIFELKKSPEIIIVYGVFTHCDLLEINRLVNILKSVLANNGIIVFSAWEDQHFNGYLNFLKKCFNLNLINDERFSSLKCDKSIYLVNREYTVVDHNETNAQDCKWLETFYNRKFLIDSLPNTIFLDGTYSHHSIFLTENKK